MVVLKYSTVVSVKASLSVPSSAGTAVLVFDSEGKKPAEVIVVATVVLAVPTAAVGLLFFLEPSRTAYWNYHN